MNLPNWAFIMIMIISILTTILISYKLSQFRKQLDKTTKELSQATKDIKE